MISNLENGRRRSPFWERELLRELSPSQEPVERLALPVDLYSESSQQIIARVGGPGELPSPSISWTPWARPAASGDVALVVRLPRDHALIVALDVVGHGPSAVPAGLYLRGWLRGWASNLSTPPLLQTFVADLSHEVERVGVALALFAAIVGRGGPGRHTVSYEGVSFGYPSPILSTGPPMMTLPSCEVMPTLPYDEPRTQVIRHELTAPWRLAIASDGLLGRVGKGSERSGVRFVMQRQVSYEREQPASDFLATTAASGDDELYMQVEGTGWDVTTAGSADEVGRLRAIEMACQRALATIDPQRVARLRQALWEIVDNVQLHSGVNAFVLRLRAEGDLFRVEVSDEGRGMPPAVDESERRGLAVVRGFANHLDLRANAPQGTVVSLVFRKAKA